jgi:hypothetical protein
VAHGLRHAADRIVIRVAVALPRRQAPQAGIAIVADKLAKRRDQVRLGVADRAGLQAEPMTAHLRYTEPPVGGQYLAAPPRRCGVDRAHRAVAIGDSEYLDIRPCLARCEINPPAAHMAS